MRTTLTLDDDVAARLTRLQRERKTSLKAIVNDALRLGLQGLVASSSKRHKKKQYTRVFVPGQILIGNIDDTAEVLAVLEGDDYK